MLWYSLSFVGVGLLLAIYATAGVGLEGGCEVTKQ